MDGKQVFTHRSSRLGAVFLMATSAIGPGFLTQTAVFSEQLKANFGFIILLSTLLDCVVQGSIWRVITFTGTPASTLLDQWFRHAGKALSLAVVFGGLIFNIGNLGGSGLGIQAMVPSVPVAWGSGLSAFLVFILLFRPSWRPVLDIWTALLGLAFLCFLFWGMSQVNIPWVTLTQGTFLPTQFNSLATITLVGGTVGGYIAFVGAHRLLESGYTGPTAQRMVWRSAISGILLTTIVRFSLFALFLGLFEADSSRTWQFADNPVGHAFSFLTTRTGFFGFIVWSAAITSALGATYTSFTFLRSYYPQAESPRYIASFLALSWVILFIWGKPAQLLILAGTSNSFILPFGLAGILWVSYKKKVPFPVVLYGASWLVCFGLCILFFKSFF